MQNHIMPQLVCQIGIKCDYYYLHLSKVVMVGSIITDTTLAKPVTTSKL